MPMPPSVDDFWSLFFQRNLLTSLFVVPHGHEMLGNRAVS
jgi:hypothetical protein